MSSTDPSDFIRLGKPPESVHDASDHQIASRRVGTDGTTNFIEGIKYDGSGKRLELYHKTYVQDLGCYLYLLPEPYREAA